MKRFLAVSILAFATNLAFAGANYMSDTDTSLYNFERGDPDEYQRIVPDRSFTEVQAPKLTSLDQIEEGNPDDSVVSGDVGPAKHAQPSEHLVTSLEKFEQGDPDVAPGL